MLSSPSAKTAQTWQCQVVSRFSLAACTHVAPPPPPCLTKRSRAACLLYPLPSRQNLVMVAGGAIFALYEVSTALSEREQKRLEAAGGGPVTKAATKVREFVA